MKPFVDCELSTVLGHQLSLVKDKIDSFSDETIVGNDIEIIVENIYQEFFIEPIVLGEEDYSKRGLKHRKIRRCIDPVFARYSGKEYVEVEGVVASFFFPYQGEKDLFRCRASVFSVSGYPEISIENGFISFQLEKTLDEMNGKNAKELLEKELGNNLKNIKNGIGYVNNEVNTFNASLKKHATDLLLKRRKNVESYFAIAKMLEVPVEKKEFAKEHIPLQRKIVPLSHHYESENYYGIGDKEYKDILDAIKHICSTYERTPKPYKAHKEEELRDILLGALNATYLGDATGEAFRNNGKTDICIERENRAAFVAECKVWSGCKEISDAVVQLDSYLTWRDCKTAIIYFVRRQDFMAILDKAEEALKKVDGMKRVETVEKNSFDCQFCSKSNPGQLVRIRVMLFNLYCK